MNYQEALEKLERLRDGYKEVFIQGSRSASFREDLYELYGELEELIHRFAGKGTILVKDHDGISSAYPNYIEAGMLSGSLSYIHEGYTQMSKIIGKVRRYAEDPSVPQVEHSVTNLIQVLHRFRECCQYLTLPLENEGDLQAVLWIMLRSHY